MGLDIYAYRVKKSVADSANHERGEIYNKLNEIAKEEFAKVTPKLLKDLEKKHEMCSPIEYAEVYMKFINTLRKKIPLFKNYSFYLEEFGYDSYRKELNSIKTPQDVAELFEKFNKRIYAVSDAYFRKVNFIYEYFRNKLVDEGCIVSKFELNEFIQVCKDVYKHKGDEDYATEYLPTTSGFFFGSTSYDEWYWNDVKDCIKQMEKIYKKLDDEDIVMWEFSW